MNSRNDLSALYSYAAAYQFAEFSRVCTKLISSLPDNELLDAYLMRAQIKLFASDETFKEDLEKAAAIQAEPRFPCLSRQWLSDSPNRFIVFNNEPGEVQKFLQMLPDAEKKLGNWFGTAGVCMVRQILSGILYFSGQFSEAIRAAREQQDMDPENHTNRILSQGILFRSYLAAGIPEKAEEAMLEMVRLSNEYPECVKPYQAIRTWANMTTGWSGDAPRFFNNFQGKTMPVLDDRQAGIQKGFGRASTLETPFVEYAKASYTQFYTIRQYYVDIFHVLYWFHTGNLYQTSSHLLNVSHTALASGLIMPFVECGGHIMPVLQHLRDHGSCSPELLARVVSLTEEFEESINTYRA
ncbi:tetratricopeptide repeat protein [Breznakiella homolactica]|uniref:Tetratricopeptide repeat protein n=1 Tax=Breznakiella homolactica TaxID=2798577 RepID=A0A7T7XK00_9SPIR|nr:hypothetical protein [Breznakiella homolactica]QQO07814.1 hypothetical protein JFL75_12785 [Breznakiella homolactica]